MSPCLDVRPNLESDFVSSRDAMVPLSGKICVVTGAADGIGKAVAIALAEAGAIVYISGPLKVEGGNETLVPCLQNTVREAEAAGGICIPVECDHTSVDDMEHLFDRVRDEKYCQLDVLVNCAFSGEPVLKEKRNEPFWQASLELWDMASQAGMRSYYIASRRAASLMVPARRGVIINVSSMSGFKALFNTAYGINKAACDRMTEDCSRELKEYGVAVLSLLPGLVKTEFLLECVNQNKLNFEEEMALSQGETPQFVAKAVLNLVTDQNIMDKTGEIYTTVDIADTFKFTDVHGIKPLHPLSLRANMLYIGKWRLAKWIPRFVMAPKSLLIANAIGP
ncbi:dehydrogenase/reductase SDR family member 1-like [Antedon mediterranea]|uniref:dehydrogenase/reductase SDR family member 1-like n=1 Tax=Antedon mediterranea TaxID=105859 RepID=UPI003AF8A70F